MMSPGSKSRRAKGHGPGSPGDAGIPSAVVRPGEPAARRGGADDPELRSASWETRYLALKRMAADTAIPVTQRATALARAAGDAHRSCRLVAATALANLAGEVSPEIVHKALVSLLSDADSWVRVRAAQGLGAVRGAEAADGLAGRLRVEPDLRVRATLVKALGHCADPRHFDLVSALLSDPDARVRANAVEGLGSYASPSVAEMLLPYLEDPAPRVRANSARVLLKFNRARALAAFRALGHADDLHARASAAFALGEVHDAASLALLFELAQDTSEVVRRNAVEALARQGKPAEAGLVTLLASPVAHVRAGACQGLARVGTKACWSRLLEQLEDPEGSVREACVRALEAVEERLSSNRRENRAGTGRSAVGKSRGNVDG